MDERKKPLKYTALAVLLVVAFSSLAAGLSTSGPAPEPTIRPAPAAGHRPYHSLWARDYLVWYA